MTNKLKQYRVRAGLTQTQLAKSVGVSQPNYQRWESGNVQVPAGKLKKLAKVLNANADALLGKHPPVETRLYDKSVGEDLSYYGEVAVHFKGGGKPLLLSISDGAFSRMHRELQQENTFLAVESLANQTVIIRARSISDLYFSSEAHDDYGPEHGKYSGHVQLQMPDDRDWEIVEALAYDGIDLEDFEKEDVERVSSRIMITDEQYDELVADGKIKPEDLEGEKKKNQKVTNRIFDLATKVKYQFSSGKRRCVDVLDEESLFETFCELTDFGEDVDDHLIRLPIEGWHRIAFINKDALDYVMLPTHRFNKGRTEVDAKMLDESDEAKQGQMQPQ